MARVARTYDTLMRRLGYDSYGIHGSDGGAMVARELGLLDPPGFLGAHVLHLFSFPSGDPAEFENLEPDGLRGPRAPAVVPVRRRLQRDQRLAPADRGRGPLRLPGRPARLERALQLLRQRHEPGEPRPDPHPGDPRLVHQHLGDGGPLPLRGGAQRGGAAGQRGAHRRRGLRRRLPDDQGVRRARQHQHRALEPTSSAAATTPRMEVPDVLAADIRAFFG